MAPVKRLLAPWSMYGALRDQLGSVRRTYLASDRIRRRDDMGRSEELVLLVHGFFQTRNIWEMMEDWLRHDGFGVMSFNLGGLMYRFNTNPVDRSAQLVAEKIESLARRHGFERLHIIGHSKGGLIARRYVQHYGGDRRAKSVITLGTPHHGTPTAFVGVALMGFGAIRSSAGDLLPRSRLVSALGRDTFPASVPLTSIYSKSDLVCPYWASVLRPAVVPEGAEAPDLANVEVPNVGHSQLVWDPAVYRVVRDRLTRAADRDRDRARSAAGETPSASPAAPGRTG